MDDPQTPEWVRDAVFYQIFPDRFARSMQVPKPSGLQPWGATPTPHGYQGGDLLGVVEKLDYLADLGVNALYLNPIFQSACNHRYHTFDYMQVDPMLGGNNALRRLLDDAHARGIRVILDGVFNHASRGFFPFHDLLENGSDSAYLDWFTVHSYPLNPYDPVKPAGYEAWWGLKALPKFNIKTPAVREFLWSVARHWIDFGSDGWRLDVPGEINDPAFWHEFRRRVRAGNPDAYLVGEIWNEAPEWLQGDRFDALMNYPLTRACLSFFIGENLALDHLKPTALYPPNPPGAEVFAQTATRLLELYSPAVTAVQFNLLDSHDTARFLTLAAGDRSALTLAWLFLMTYPGTPCIYYGDEIGLTGGHDPHNRGAFPWDASRWDHDLLHTLQRLIALRTNSIALRRGEYRTLYAHGDVHVHLRSHPDEDVLVALNTARAARRVDLCPGWPDASGIEELWSHSHLATHDGWLREFELPARGGRVLRRRPRP